MVYRSKLILQKWLKLCELKFVQYYGSHFPINPKFLFIEYFREIAQKEPFLPPTLIEQWRVCFIDSPHCIQCKIHCILYTVHLLYSTNTSAGCGFGLVLTGSGLFCRMRIRTCFDWIWSLLPDADSDLFWLDPVYSAGCRFGIVLTRSESFCRIQNQHFFTVYPGLTPKNIY